MNESLQGHDDLLRKDVFQTETKWPQFRRLLDDIDELSGSLDDGALVVSLERGMLYGGYSMIGPYFHRQRFIGVDCSPSSADKRGSYNAAMVDDDRLIKVPSDRRVSVHDTGLESGIADLVVVPNLVHHVADQSRLFSEIGRLVRKGGKAYVFEPTFRELHQIPDDFLRYTPFGMKRILELNGFEILNTKHEGNAFTAIAYCWTQALEYFPKEKREEMSQWFYDTHFPELVKWDEQYKENLCRKHTSFPTAFSILAEKIN